MVCEITWLLLLLPLRKENFQVLSCLCGTLLSGWWENTLLVCKLLVLNSSVWDLQALFYFLFVCLFFSSAWVYHIMNLGKLWTVTVEREKRNLISTSNHVLFCLSYKHDSLLLTRKVNFLVTADSFFLKTKKLHGPFFSLRPPEKVISYVQRRLKRLKKEKRYHKCID